jgi:hypothetical protein
MMGLAVKIELANMVPGQGSQHTDPCEHRWPTLRRYKDQRFQAGCHSAASCPAFGSFVM